MRDYTDSTAALRDTDDYEQLIPGKFDAVSGVWVEVACQTDGPMLTELKLLSYNVWFSDRHGYERWLALMQILAEVRPDIIALQELTIERLELLLQQDWVRREYCISDIDGATINPYGVLLLSRLPLVDLRLYDLPSEMYRRLLVAECWLNGQRVKVATVHLESMREETPRRIEQLKTIFSILQNTEHAVLMGDFNFRSPRDRETAHIGPEYRDLWAELHPDDPGCQQLGPSWVVHAQTQGLDRMLVRSPDWQPRAIELLGEQPIVPETPDVYSSDHCGLLGVLEWCG